MQNVDDLHAVLKRIDGRPYPAWKDVRGTWRIGDFVLLIDHVQGDPFAAPSRLRVRVPTGIGEAVWASPIQRMAAEDWILRRFARALVGQRRGSGRSGELGIYRPGPQVLRRSSVLLSKDGTAEIRFSAGLPARGRRVLGRQGWYLLSEDIPDAASQLLGIADDPELAAQIRAVQTQSQLRGQLREHGLVAFIADGSVLPRASGIDQRPLADAVPFTSPAALRVTLQTDAGPVCGMGIEAGITLLVGGGFHGKSTVLQAIQLGHLDHIPGDGRERVVADVDTVKVRAEDGRRVCAVDISNFLRDLPGGRSTAPFSTDDASGSTSQAASIIEAVESGARVILMDEDTCATHLMVRDERMRAVVPREKEPITPLVEHIRALYSTWGVSTILVVSGVGDYLRVADRVIIMDEWLPIDGTQRAREIVGPVAEGQTTLCRPLGRVLRPQSLRPTGKGRVRARDERRIDYGREEIDLTAVEQVLDGAHAASIGHALRELSEGLADGSLQVPAILDALESFLRAEGIDGLSPYREPIGGLLWPRRHEVAAALNRLRTIEVSGSH